MDAWHYDIIGNNMELASVSTVWLIILWPGVKSVMYKVTLVIIKYEDINDAWLITRELNGDRWKMQWIVVWQRRKGHVHESSYYMNQ